MTSVFSITFQRRAVSTPLPERSSSTVLKMLHQMLEDSRKASKSGAETYAKVICLCDETRHEAVAVTEPTIADTVHSSVVRAIDCRSAGPWLNSGRRSWFTFMTWSSNQIIQMINIMSPITTIITKSVNTLCFFFASGPFFFASVHFVLAFCVNRTLCFLACTLQSCTAHTGCQQSVSLMAVLWTLAQDRTSVSPVKMKAVSTRLVIASSS